MRRTNKKDFKNWLFSFNDPQAEKLYKESSVHTYAANFYKLMGIYAFIFISIYVIRLLISFIRRQNPPLDLLGLLADATTGGLFLIFGCIIIKWPKYRQFVAIFSLFYYYGWHFELEIQEYNMVNGFVWFMVYQVWGLGVCIEVLVSPFLSILAYFIVCLYVALRIVYYYLVNGSVDEEKCFRNGLLYMYLVYCLAVFLLFCFLFYTSLKSKKLSFLKAYKTMETFKKTMDLLPDGIVVINDVTQDLLFHNSSALKLLQCQNTHNIITRINKCRRNVVDNNLDLSTVRIIMEADESFDPTNLELKEEKIEFYESEATLYLLTDISNIKNLEEEKAQSKHRNMFVSTITHELRTPVNCIQGNLECLLVGVPKAVGQKYIRVSMNSCHLLTSLINDILDLAKMEEGLILISNEPCKILEILNFAKEVMEIQAELKNLEIITNISEDTPSTIISDERRIKQVLLNFLSNALKFTKEGEIAIIVDTFVDQEHSTVQYVRFSVKDSGVGISEGNIIKLFEPFTMLKETQKMNKSGSGIGLNICKKLVQAMGGNVHATSTIKVGSIFSFWIPIIQNLSPLSSRYSKDVIEQSILSFPEEYQTPRKKVRSMTYVAGSPEGKEFLRKGSAIKYIELLGTESPKRGIVNEETKEMMPLEAVNKTKSILIVDDDSFSSFTLSNMIKTLNMNMDIDTATDGYQAIEMVLKREYDIIFMDWTMPLISGLQTCIEINKLFEDGRFMGNSEIIALTGVAAESIYEECQNVNIRSICKYIYIYIYIR